MAKLRKTVHGELREILDKTVFTSDDFDVDFCEDEEAIINIKLKYGENLFFTIKDGAFGMSYMCIRSPGELYETSTFQAKTLHDCFGFIPDWAIEARNELKAQSPTFRDIDELKKTIETHFNTEGNSAEEFTVEEINSLKRKFDLLLERVAVLEKENQITKKQFEEFKSGIDQVSEDLEYYPKSTWVKTASNKVYNTMTSIGKSKEGRAILADGAKKLMGIE